MRQQVQTVMHRINKEVSFMKRMNIVVINGEERQICNLPEEEQERLAAEWNRRALEAIGYRRINTA